MIRQKDIAGIEKRKKQLISLILSDHDRSSVLEREMRIACALTKKKYDLVAI